ncbi:unnamed protein product [Cuscuta campestris]|uniref:Uncharacterized protein n=1 Tax=Cuscuta campestris TaxID=132261 RepID=A0A484LN16_9ASTE|nr:unnamed protein product [Cuscuta campestris]
MSQPDLSSVGRAEDCSMKADILRSLVRIRQHCEEEVLRHLMRKLKLGAQKVQLQNWKLAQSNTHMAAVKALQHELVCKEAILKAKTNKDKKGEVGESTPYVDDAKSVKSNMKLQATRRKSMVHLTPSQQVASKGGSDNKRDDIVKPSKTTKRQPFGQLGRFTAKEGNP